MLIRDSLNKTNIQIYAQLLEQLEKHLTILPDKPEETPENTLRSLWLFVQGQPVSAVKSIDKQIDNLNKSQLDQLKSLILVRLKGKPLAYIVGRHHYMGLDFLTSESALIPRIETELLAEACLKLAKASVEDLNNMILIDLFTGSGNLPIALANEFPGAAIYGSDLSKDAIELAKNNNEFHNTKIEFKCGDMFEPFDMSEFEAAIDLISGCPPYIIDANVEQMPDEISEYEPKMAFSAGPFGFTFLMRLMKESLAYLKQGGWLVFEVGLGQGEGIVKRL
ncbi:MAG: HemK family protein methyltransferase, partial [Gammaproteobacteria bacterium]|nr:HemK family protein methyltransferase [Gammaproteobacteria bacterium]